MFIESVADDFYSCLPEVVNQCDEDVLHTLSLVSKSYYKRIRENPLVSCLYQWRPHVSLKDLALSDKRFAAYYETATSGFYMGFRDYVYVHNRILRWRDNIDTAALQEHINYNSDQDEDLALTLQDLMLSDKWTEFDVTKVDADYGTLLVFLTPVASQRLSTLCENAGVQTDYYGPEHPDSETELRYHYRTDSLVRPRLMLGKTYDHLVTSGFFELVNVSRTLTLVPPSYMPLSVQVSLGSERIPRYNSLQEYSEMLTSWWLPRAYELKLGGGPIAVDYNSLVALQRLKILEDFAMAASKLGKKLVVAVEGYMLAGVEFEELAELLCAILPLPKRAIVVRCGSGLCKSICEHLKHLSALYDAEGALAFFELLYELSESRSRNMIRTHLIEGHTLPDERVDLVGKSVLPDDLRRMAIAVASEAQ